MTPARCEDSHEETPCRSADYLGRDPQVTPSILAELPECLRAVLKSQISKQCGLDRRKSLLVSSNSLANRFVLDKWGIRASQRRQYKPLFAAIRAETRHLFRYYLLRKKIEWTSEQGERAFGVFEFDETRGNMILGFVPDESTNVIKRTTSRAREC